MDEKEFDYMNVIPLVDVMLVLLTIVLTTSTSTLKTQVIEIDKTGNIYLNSNITTLGGLKNSLKSIDNEVPILIRADKSIVLQFFVDVMDTLKSLGFKKLSLQTEEK